MNIQGPSQGRESTKRQHSGWGRGGETTIFDPGTRLNLNVLNPPKVNSENKFFIIVVFVLEHMLTGGGGSSVNIPATQQHCILQL
jgi:hypothetical protein